MSSSSFLSRATVTYTSMSDNSDRPSFGIPLVYVYGYRCDASEAASPSPKDTPISPAYALEHAPLADDDLEPTVAQALPAHVSPAPLSPDYSTDSKPIKDDPQEVEEDLEEEELPTMAASTPAIADLASPSKETEPFKEDEVAPTPPSPISSHAIIHLSYTQLCRARKFEIRESSAVAAARQPGSTLAQGTRDRLVFALEETNETVINLGTSYRKDSHEIYDQRASLSEAERRRQSHQGHRTRQTTKACQRARKMAPKKNSLSATTIEELIAQHVADALADYETNRNSESGNDNRNGSPNSGGGSGKTSHTARTPMKMMTKAYCPRSEIQKLETELWNLIVKSTDVETYTQRFQELVLLCSRMVHDETDNVKRYVRGLPDNIQGTMMASKPKILQKAIEFARSLMDQKVLVYVPRQDDNKRRMDNNPRNNLVQQQPYIRQNVARDYTYEPGEKREYAGTLPL
nr:reverse transcriptase domain-containing protein [Tanacetum cinerariifolium]